MSSNAVSLNVDMLSDLPAKAVLALVAKHRETKRYFEQAQNALRDFPALFLSVEEMDIDVGFDPDLRIIRVSFSGDGPRLGKVWGALRRAGFDCDSRPKKGDTEFSGWFRQEGYPPVVVHFTSTLCRRIKIGTKTVEQDVYQTICGEELALETPAVPAPVLITSGDTDDIPF